METLDKKVRELLNTQRCVSPDLKEAHEQFMELKKQGIIKGSSYDIPLMNRLTVRNRREKEDHKIAAFLDC